MLVVVGMISLGRVRIECRHSFCVVAAAVVV